jgi:GTP-binding protein
MKIMSAEYMSSVVSRDKYPIDSKPEILLLGRSNVGKSSFINKLLNRKKLAYTSSKPGKTQTLNFYLINDGFYFVDVPGYGYAKVSKKQREQFGQMIEEYLVNRKVLKRAVLLVDMRHKPSEDDQLMYKFLKYYDIPTLVVATKHDKVKSSMRKKNRQVIMDTLELDENDLFAVFSSETGVGKDQVWSILENDLRG